MLLQNEGWELRAATPAERDELLAYAEAKGVPVWRPNFCNPKALLLGWFQDLMAYEGKPDAGPVTTPDEFRRMCDEFTPIPAN